ncbi:hypothetical protein KFL_016190010, partial [Klebsormidium nitens]
MSSLYHVISNADPQTGIRSRHTVLDIGTAVTISPEAADRKSWGQATDFVGIIKEFCHTATGVELLVQWFYTQNNLLQEGVKPPAEHAANELYSSDSTSWIPAEAVSGKVEILSKSLAAATYPPLTPQKLAVSGRFYCCHELVVAERKLVPVSQQPTPSDWPRCDNLDVTWSQLCKMIAKSVILTLRPSQGAHQRTAKVAIPITAIPHLLEAAPCSRIGTTYLVWNKGVLCRAFDNLLGEHWDLRNLNADLKSIRPESRGNRWWEGEWETYHIERCMLYLSLQQSRYKYTRDLMMPLEVRYCWTPQDDHYEVAEEASLDVFTEEGNASFTIDNLLLKDTLTYVREQIVEFHADDAPRKFQFSYRGTL